MSTQPTDTRRIPAATRTRSDVLELRALIAVALADIVAIVPKVTRFIAHPEDTHQATSSFLTVEAKAYIDDLVRSERADRHRNALDGIKITGEVPAPVGVAASSIVDEIRTYLADVVHRLTTKLERAGVCAITGRSGAHEAETVRDTLYDDVVRLRALVDLVANPMRLRPIHRTLEDLLLRARRAANGPDTAALPDPCPHCGRMSLVVHLADGITRCERDSASRQRQPCRCTEPYCPCTRDRDYRHEWSRAAKAHTSTSWQGLRRSQKEARLNAEAIARVRALHEEIQLQPWTADCPDQQARTFTHEQLVTAVGSVCLSCPPAATVCWHCTQLAGLDSFVNAPCATVSALDGTVSADDKPEQQNPSAEGARS